MRKIKEVLRLKYESSLSERKISGACQIGRATVSEYIRRFKSAQLEWPLPQGLTQEELESRLFPVSENERKSKGLGLDYVYWLQELAKPNVTREVLWSEYQQTSPEGVGYSRFCSLLREYQKTLKYSLRQEHKGGEKVFLDFGQGLDLVDPQTGESVTTNLFVAAWGASNYTYVHAVLRQDVANWISVNVGAMTFFGVSPRILVPDNLKAAVTKPCYYEPQVHPAFLDFSRHYQTLVMPARPRKPKDKAKVENAVKLAKRWILARLRNRIFTSLHEMNETIAPLLEKFNNKLMKKIGKSRRELFEALDKPHALPLPEKAYEYADWKPVKAGPDYHVEYERHYYSVPYTHIHRQLEVRATALVVEILHRGERLASHARSYQKHGYTTVMEHRPPAHQKYLLWTPERIKTWAQKSGEAVSALVCEIMARREFPETAYRSCLGIIRLAQRFPVERLNAACSRALTFRILTYQGVKNILSKNLDQLPPETTTPQNQSHENIRGAKYYGQEVVTIH
jgi:transposase